MLPTSVHQLQDIWELHFPRFGLWGHCIHLSQSEIGLSIAWLTKTMLNKVCFVAKTKYHTILGYQMICVQK